MRLVGHNSASQGNVQAYFNNTWVDLCYSVNTPFNLADVVCQQLGYRGDSNYYGIATTTPSVLSSIQCNGKELNIMDCNSMEDFNILSPCQSGQKIFVICKGKLWSFSTEHAQAVIYCIFRVELRSINLSFSLELWVCFIPINCIKPVSDKLKVFIYLTILLKIKLYSFVIL